MPAYVSDVAAPCAWSLHVCSIDYHAQKLSIGFPLTVSGVRCRIRLKRRNPWMKDKKWGCIETGDATWGAAYYCAMSHESSRVCRQVPPPKWRRGTQVHHPFIVSYRSSDNLHKKWGCIETGDAMNVQLCFSVVIYDIYSTCVEIQVTYLGTVGVLMMIIHKNERNKL